MDARNQWCLAAALCAAAGCGLSGEALVQTGPRTETTEAALRDPCEKPPTRAPAPGEVQAVAEAAAKAFGDALVSVSPARATLSGVSDAAVRLPPCAPLATADQAVLDHLAALPDAFRLRAKEWAWDGAPRCDQVPEAGEWYRLSRREAGGSAVSNQSIALRLAYRRGALELLALHGHYLPADAALEARLASCSPVDDGVLHAALFEEKYPYVLFQYCWPLGDGVYLPAKGDRTALAKAPAWRFDDTGSEVVLRLLREASLSVGEKNITPELLRSNAACAPDNVGFQATVDALSGAVVGTAPGLGCVVCAAGGP